VTHCYPEPWSSLPGRVLAGDPSSGARERAKILLRAISGGPATYNALPVTPWCLESMLQFPHGYSRVYHTTNCNTIYCGRWLVKPVCGLSSMYVSPAGLVRSFCQKIDRYATYSARVPELPASRKVRRRQSQRLSSSVWLLDRKSCGRKQLPGRLPRYGIDRDAVLTGEWKVAIQ